MGRKELGREGVWGSKPRPCLPSPGSSSWPYRFSLPPHPNHFDGGLWWLRTRVPQGLWLGRWLGKPTHGGGDYAPFRFLQLGCTMAPPDSMGRSENLSCMLYTYQLYNMHMYVIYILFIVHAFIHLCYIHICIHTHIPIYTHYYMYITFW